jgi:hypothetical protein
MKRLFTILSLFFIYSLQAQERLVPADTSAMAGSKIKSCSGYSDNNDLQENSKHNPFITTKGNDPLSWIERINLLGFIEDRYFLNDKRTVQFIGNTTIDSSDIINCNIIIFDGTLTINKNISESIAGVNSKIIIKNNSDIKGSVILFNSSIIADSSFQMKNVICGDLNDYDRNIVPNYTYNYFGHPNFRYFNEESPGRSAIRYNRVEGLYLGINSDKKYYWNGKKNESFYGTFGYGFGNHRWSGVFGYDRWFGNSDRTEVGIEAHSITDSKDNWRVDNTENSLAAFFIHEDYKDYFLKEGWSVHTAKYFDRSTVIDVKFINDNYRSQTNNTDWSLFGGDKRFRFNPPAKEGLLQNLIFSVNHVTADQKEYMPNGWNISANYEIAGGISVYNRVLVDIRRYFLFDNQNHISLRVMAGSADHFLPWQKSFELGGIGTIPAVSHNSLSGNKMLMANIDYSIPFIDVFTGFFNWNNYHHNSLGNLIISYDAGYAYDSPSNNLFKGFSIDKQSTRQDLGLSFGFDRNKFRIGAAFRLDKNEPAQFIFRLNQPF